MAPTGGVLMPSSRDHFALNNNSNLGQFSDEDLERFINEMTAFPFDDENNVLLSWTGQHSLNSTSLSSPSSTEVQIPKTPANGDQPVSVSGNSLSPTDLPLIYTPASTLLEYPTAGGFDSSESDVQSSNSPMSSFSPGDDYVHVGSLQGAARSHRHGTAPDQPQRTEETSLRSHAVVDPPLEVSATRQNQPHPQPGAFHQWQTCSFSSSNDYGMDSRQSYQYASTTTSAGLPFDGSMADRMTPDMVAFEHTYPTPGYQNHALPFRQADDASFLPSPYGCSAILPQQVPFHSDRIQAQNSENYASASYQATPTPSNAAASMALPQRPFMSSTNLAYNQYLQEMAQGNVMYNSRSNTNQSLQIPPPAAPLQRQKERFLSNNELQSSTTILSRHAQEEVESNTDRLPSAAMVALRGRRPSNVTRPVATSSAARTEPAGVRNRKGGRVKGNHLPEQTRAKTTVMRKIGACWRCALQRDPCDHNETCKRCASSMQSQRGQAYFFGCDRSKLPDFVHDFLPPSMTYMHQKQSIEDTVSSEVNSWSHSNPISIQLSSGYGPPLQWIVHEFSPRSPELLSQLQYYTQDHRMAPTFKYSPPYGLLKIDTSDQAHMDNYLNELLEPTHLPDFAWCCYEEECITDPEAFQAGTLDLMCKLYLETSDEILKDLLRTILRLQLVTFIMGHTLTLTDTSLPTTLSNLRYTRPPSPHTLSTHTSPRLASRQLKFFFSLLRLSLSTQLLKWLQSTLHTAGRKHLTFLPSFLVMLGFAMSLEEVQRTIIIQADAKVRRGKGLLDEREVEQEARNACERIDERWSLLVGLFQCKYRDKKWGGGNGSFGSGTPVVEGEGGRFLRELRELVEGREDHLRSRSEVPFSVDNQCLYTTRLTARFLLPFLKLPKT